MLKKGLSILLIIVLLFPALFNYNHLESSASDVWSLSSDTGWTIAYTQNNQNDYLQDQQTGSGTVSQDIVGDNTYPSTYLHFSENEVAFKVRVNDIDGGTDSSDYQFKNFAFVGIDADCNGSVDFFMGAYNPSGNTGRIGIFKSDSSSANISPSTTGISVKPLVAFKPVRNSNYSITQANDSSNFNGDSDYFVSFKINLTDLSNALSTVGITFSSSTPFRFMTGTAAQDNSFNQDLNGMDSNGWSSGKTWNSLGVFSNVTTITNGYSSTYKLVTLDKNTGDNDPFPSVKVVASGSTIGSLPSDLTKKGGFYFQGWNTLADGSGKTVTNNTIITSDMTIYAQWSSQPIYNVTFDPNGGNWSGSAQTLSVSSINGIIGGNMPSDPTKVGYVFNGWTTVKDNNNSLFDSSTSVSSSITVYAYWVTAGSAKTPVNFYNSDGTILLSSIFPNGNSSNYNTNAPIPSRIGYTFAGWSTTINGSSVSLTGGTKIGNNPSIFSYYAVWQVAVTDYTITYNANGGTLTDVASKNVINGLFGTLPSTPTRNGYLFIEWNKINDGTGEAIYPTTSITGNTTVYAIWKAIQTVTFDANNGSFDDASTSKTANIVDGSLRMLPQSPFRTGYSFLGWNTSNSASTPNVNLYGSSFVQNQTLYAVWSPIYDVTFNPNNGDWNSDTTPQVIGTAYGSILYLPDSPTRTGYTFKEWNTNSTGVGGTKLTMTTDIVANTTVYAIWTPLPGSTYTVDFVTNGGSAVDSLDTDQILVTPNSTRNGYTLEGWYSDSGLTAENVIAFPYSVTQNISLYAKWAPISYSLTYTLNNGSLALDNPTSYTIETTDFTLTNPTRSGYNFQGWTGTGLDNATSNVTITQGSNGDRSYQATWQGINTTITLDDNNGSGGSGTVTGIYDQSMPVASTPVRAGYTFNGYYDAVSGGTQYYSNAMASLRNWDKTGATETLYAHWITDGDYSITYTLDGGNLSEGQSNPESYTVESITFTLINPTKNGYNFAGWTGTGIVGSALSVSVENGSTGNLAYTATWQAKTYTVTLDPNGGSNGTTQINAVYGMSMPAATKPDRENYIFIGYFDALTDGTAYYDSEMNSIQAWNKPNSDQTLYAHWSQSEIKGTIKDDATPATIVPNTTIKIMKGNTQYGNTATSNANGEFSIYNVPAGTYNLIMTLDDKTEIVEITVQPNTAVTQLGVIIFPLGNASSLLKLGNDTPPIVINNLHTQALDYFDGKNDNSIFVKVEMTVEKTDEETADAGTLSVLKDIKETVTNDALTVGVYLDMVIDKYFRATENDNWTPDGKITETNGLIKVTIPIPSDLQGKSSYTIYRYHDANVNVISTIANASGEYLTLDKSTWTLTLYVKKFSIYAIAYPKATSSIANLNHTVTFNTDNGLPMNFTQIIEYGQYATIPSIPKKDGYLFDGWIRSDGSIWNFTSDKVFADIILTAKWVQRTSLPQLDTVNHIAYMKGYPDGSFKPERNITRAEVAVMFTRLLTEKMQMNTNYASVFTDIDPKQWYANEVGFLQQLGILKGYLDNTFRPNSNIKRSEFITIASSFETYLDQSVIIYTDVTSNYWAKDSIAYATSKGWSMGYTDGTFRPEAFITREEVILIMNRILGRQGDQEYIKSKPSLLNRYKDLSVSYKNFYDILEASIEHDYSLSTGSETWNFSN